MNTLSRPNQKIHRDPLVQFPAHQLNTHDHVTKFSENFTLQRFGHVVCNHFLCRTPLRVHLTMLDSVRNKEITNIHVFGLLRTRELAILPQKNSDSFVLIKDIIIHLISLINQKVTLP